jgi:uncharacterized protein (TIGR03643 family)
MGALSVYQSQRGHFTLHVPMQYLECNPSEQVSLIIRYAWEDRTTFEQIEKCTGHIERQVIEVMSRELKPSSFRMWRKRVSGRFTKHRKLLKQHLNGLVGDE